MAIEDEYYNKRVVAFIDILGFKSHIEESEMDPDYYVKIKRALNYIASLKADNDSGYLAEKEIGKEVTVFSDSIVISYPMSLEGAVFYLLMDVIHVQIDLLAHGILIRGGVTIGNLSHNDNIVFGKAMIEAYNLENEQAIFPRVLIAPDVLERGAVNGVNEYSEELKYLKGIVSTDKKDEKLFVEYLGQYQEVNSNDEYITLMKRSRNVIKRGIANAPNVQVKDKYIWLRDYYIDVVSGFIEPYRSDLQY